MLQAIVVLVLVVASLALAAYDARRDARTVAEARALAVARAVADSPTVVEAIGTPDPTSVLQPVTERVRRDTGVDFVVVMALDRTRYTHTNPEQIGRKFIGDLGAAPDGVPFTQQYTGTLGPSVRAVVPVERDGEVVALVSAGLLLSQIDRDVRGDLGLVALVAAAVLGVGLVGTLLVVRRLRRATHGLGEREITRMYEYYSAVLHAVQEGLLLIDDEERVQLANDEAVRLLSLPDDVVGRSVHELDLPPGLVRAALGRTRESDDVYVAGDHVLVVSSAPATWQGREVGAVVTLRDHTQLRAVTGELDLVRGLTDSLRAQTHEAANRLHTVVSLVEMGRPDDAVEFATEELRTAQLLTDRVIGAVGEPVVAALLLGKTSEAAERGIELGISGELPPDLPLDARDLVTIVGNLVDNAFDAVAGRPERRVEVAFANDPGGVEIVVGDSGPGLGPEAADHVLERGWTTKADAAGPAGGRGIGLALVGQAARRHRGQVAIGRSHLGGAEFRVRVSRSHG